MTQNPDRISDRGCVGKAETRHMRQSLPLLPPGPGGFHASLIAGLDHKRPASGSALPLPKQRQRLGGERGIRTLGTRERTHEFQSCTFNHSVTSPHICTGGTLIGPRPVETGRGQMAEREGFEPPVRVNAHLISNQAPSTNSAISPSSDVAGSLRARSPSKKA
jgi:hypothetical protein